MKRTVLLFLCLYALGSFAQSYDLKKVREVKFFGVDYSKVKVFGATETEMEFASAFERINMLFLSEADKYDMSKFLQKHVYEISIEEVSDKIRNADFSEMKTGSRKHRLSQEDLQNAVTTLNNEPEEGVGVVFVAEMLNKAEGVGFYRIVFFDMQTKEVIDSFWGQGKSGGFGLRNYWAGSIHHMKKKGRIYYDN